MVVLNRIYTRTGDDVTTALGTGALVANTMLGRVADLAACPRPGSRRVAQARGARSNASAALAADATRHIQR